MLTLASDFTLATAVNEASLPLPILPWLPLRALRWANESFHVTGSSCLTEGSFLP